MTTGAVVITWGAPVRGREAKGLEVFGKALAFMSEQAKQGVIHGHKEYITVTGNASKLAGIQIVEGDVAQLQTLLLEERFQRLTIEAAAITENFTVTLTVGGSDQAVQQEVTRYAEALQSLGYL